MVEAIYYQKKIDKNSKAIYHINYIPNDFS